MENKKLDSGNYDICFINCVCLLLGSSHNRTPGLECAFLGNNGFFKHKCCSKEFHAGKSGAAVISVHDGKSSGDVYFETNF